MNKRFAIIGVIVFIGAAIGIQALTYFASLKTVTINIQRAGVTVDIDSTKNDQLTKVASLTASGKISLTKGNYAILPAGKNVNPSPIFFTIDSSNTAVNVNPPLSDAYLAQLLTAKQAAISTAIAAAYPKTATGAKLTSGKLYREGDWYGGYLLQNSPARGNNGDYYRIVLHNEDGQWKAMTKPEIVLTSKNYPDVPVEILRDINQPPAS